MHYGRDLNDKILNILGDYDLINILFQKTISRFIISSNKSPLFITYFPLSRCLFFFQFNGMKSLFRISV